MLYCMQNIAAEDIQFKFSKLDKSFDCNWICGSLRNLLADRSLFAHKHNIDFPSWNSVVLLAHNDVTEF